MTRESMMNTRRIAEELVMVAELLVGKKGEVPEAFKKQWKDKDKDNDGKTNEPKPDFLKKKEEEKGKKSSEEQVAEALITLAEAITADGGTFKCPDCGTKVLEKTGFCVKCKKKVKKAASSTKFGKVKPGTHFEYKGKTYWKASPTRACLQKDLKRIRPDEEVSV
jgi:DNA-directed RNA polymerase subunit RPC12/RpoP